MCQTTLDIILVCDYSLDGACYNDGNGVEFKCRDVYSSKLYIDINFKSNFDHRLLSLSEQCLDMKYNC